MYLTLQALPCLWYASSMTPFMNLPMAGSRLFLRETTRQQTRKSKNKVEQFAALNGDVRCIETKTDRNTKQGHQHQRDMAPAT